MIDTRIMESAKFDPGITGQTSNFTFVKAELDGDFIWTMTLKFRELPPKISMRYRLHFYLDPEPTQKALQAIVNRLAQKQLELGVDMKDKEEETIEQILETKRRYDLESQEMGIHSFDVAVLEFKNKVAGKEIKFLTRLSTIQVLEKLKRDMHLDSMVVALDVMPEDERGNRELDEKDF